MGGRRLEMQLAQQATLLQQLAAQHSSHVAAPATKHHSGLVGPPPPYKGSQGKKLCDWVADDHVLSAAAAAAAAAASRHSSSHACTRTSVARESRAAGVRGAVDTLMAAAEENRVAMNAGDERPHHLSATLARLARCAGLLLLAGFSTPEHGVGIPRCV
jgi:hypothetical protein